jgi:hypothetical protein
MTISITFSQFKARNRNSIAPTLMAVLVMGWVIQIELYAIAVLALNRSNSRLLCDDPR